MDYKVIYLSGNIEYPETLGHVEPFGHDLYSFQDNGDVLYWAATEDDGLEVWKQLPDDLAQHVASSISYDYPNSIFD